MLYGMVHVVGPNGQAEDVICVYVLSQDASWQGENALHVMEDAQHSKHHLTAVLPRELGSAGSDAHLMGEWCADQSTGA